MRREFDATATKYSTLLLLLLRWEQMITYRHRRRRRRSPAALAREDGKMHEIVPKAYESVTTESH
jgi:hypothetical protein